MKTILHLPTWFPDESHPFSGIFTQKQIEAISRYDRERRHIVITLNGEFIPLKHPLRFFQRLLKKRKISVVQKETYTVYSIDYFLSHKQLFGPISKQLQKQIEHCIRKEKLSFHLLHAHVAYTAGAIAMELSKKFSVPYIISEHMSPFPFPEQRKKLFLEKYIVAPIQQAAAVIAVSRHQKEEIIQYTKQQKNISIIPNVIDVEMPAKRKKKQQAKIVFAIVGMLNTNAKGLDILIEAVKILKNKNITNFSIQVAGSGKFLESLQQQAKELGVADFFYWLGALPHSKILELMNDADAYICASRHESFGVAVVEALSFGKPVVATNCGGTADTVNERNGILVENESSEALAQGIHRMLLHIHEFDKEAIIAETKSKYSSAIIAGQYIQLYNKILGET